MKPDWKDAPPWARWLAMDEDGEWFWYEKEPAEIGWMFGSDGGRMECAAIDPDDWRKTLEQRPE